MSNWKEITIAIKLLVHYCARQFIRTLENVGINVLLEMKKYNCK